MNINTEDVAFIWKSSCCLCRATPEEVICCDTDHSKWARLVSSDSFRSQYLLARKLAARGFDENFSNKLHHWRRVAEANGCFFREQLVPVGELSAEMSMYLVESLGALILRCADPEALASYRQGKSILGLMEREWIESDRWPEGSLIFPEELVAGDSIAIENAEALFARKMCPELMAVARAGVRP